MKRIIAMVISVLFVFSIASVMAGPGCKEHKKHEGKIGCVIDGVCVMNLDADYSVVNTKDGVVITIKAKKAGTTAAEIQEKAKKCVEMFAAKKGEKAAASDEDVVCPVMGTKMKKSKAFEAMEYDGKTYYVCCALCKEKFLADPKKYIKK